MGLTGVILSARFRLRPIETRLRDGGDPGRTRPRRDDGPVRGVPRLAPQRGLDRLPGAGRGAGPCGDDARRVHGARRTAAAPRVQHLAPGACGQAPGSRRCAVRPAQPGLDRPLQRALLPARAGTSGVRGAARSISTASSFLSTGSRRGPPLRAAGVRPVPVRAAQGRERGRDRRPCWSASPRRDKARSSGCSSCSAPPGRG